MTWLHYASGMGDAQVVQLLVREEGDQNVLKVYKETPLFMACQGGHYEVAYYLIPLRALKFLIQPRSLNTWTSYVSKSWRIWLQSSSPEVLIKALPVFWVDPLWSPSWIGMGRRV